MVWINTKFILRHAVGMCVVLALLSGCAAMPKSGPSADTVIAAPRTGKMEGLVLCNVDEALTRKIMEHKKMKPFAEVFSTSSAPKYIINPGDIIEVSVWESPPNMLFGGVALDSKTGAITTRAETLPPQMVMEDGKITMPFAGRIDVKGRVLREIEQEIIRRLQGQANQPQVIVRTVQSASSTVAVLGDVNQSMLLPLTPKGEKLLDAIAMAGGVTQGISRVSVQLSRNSLTASMPLDSIIQNPKQNIPLLPGDVVTALYQPKSFAILGAVTKNEEIPFEAKGISLAQALARAGGLADTRANPSGVFLFRFEDSTLLSSDAGVEPAANGTVPVIYHVDFGNPEAFFATQNFPVQDRDVIYVANAGAADLEKFLKMVGTVLTPAVNLTNVVRLWNYE